MAISAIILARDEAANGHIQRCVPSLRALCDEIVVVDSGSSDGTAEIAASLGARVFHEPWRDDWAFHNNLAMDKAVHDWVLLVDADEELIDTDPAEVHEFLRTAQEDVHFVRMPIAHPSGKQTTTHSLRVVRRNSGVRWVYPIHAQLERSNGGSLEAGISGITLNDYGYATAAAVKSKTLRNLRIAEKMEPCAHKFHCVMKSAFGADDWTKCRDAARAILGTQNVQSVIVEDACVYGAAACINLEDWQEACTFADTGRRLSPGNPDIHLVASIASLEWYLHSLRGGNGIDDRSGPNPWTWWHNLHSPTIARDELLGLINAGVSP